MKSWIIKHILTGLVWILFITVTIPIHADEPPDPPSHHGSAEDLPPGGGVPVDGGTGIVLVLAWIYAMYRNKKCKPI